MVVEAEDILIATKKRENKRKLICIVKDFVKFPSPNPIFRGEIITETIQRMFEAGELSDKHYSFFNRVVQMELTIILNENIEEQHMSC